jgi:hypothetical protein
MPSPSREITPVHICGRSPGASAGASPGSSVGDTTTDNRGRSPILTPGDGIVRLDFGFGWYYVVWSCLDDTMYAWCDTMYAWCYVWCYVALFVLLNFGDLILQNSVGKYPCKINEKNSRQHLSRRQCRRVRPDHTTKWQDLTRRHCRRLRCCAEMRWAGPNPMATPLA